MKDLEKKLNKARTDLGQSLVRIRHLEDRLRSAGEIIEKQQKEISYQKSLLMYIARKEMQ